MNAQKNHVSGLVCSKDDIRKYTILRNRKTFGGFRDHHRQTILVDSFTHEGNIESHVYAALMTVNTLMAYMIADPYALARY